MRRLLHRLTPPAGRPVVLALGLALAACAAPPPPPVAGLPAPDMAAAKALLAPDETLQVLDFPMKGTRSLAGRMAGGTDAFAVPAAAGQTVQVVLTGAGNATGFTIYDVAHPRTAAHRGSVDGRRASLHATTATTFVIRPFEDTSPSSQATPNYRLTVTRE